MKTKFFAGKGRIVESRDVVAWGERLAYIKLAAVYGGYHDPKRPPAEPPDATAGLVYRALGNRLTTSVKQTVTEVTQTQEQAAVEVKRAPTNTAPEIIVTIDDVEDY